jgi:hypothetical protein
MAPVKFNVFGRLILVERVADGWQVFYFGAEGKRRPAEDIYSPSAIPEDEIESYLADLCHESATPRNPRVVRMP